MNADARHFPAGPKEAGAAGRRDGPASGCIVAAPSVRTERYAALLDQAGRDAAPIAQWTGDARLTLDEAYAVQAQGIALRCARGDRVVGLKLAFTNRRTMARVGVSEPVSGVLCAGMELAAGGVLPWQGLTRPRAEPEVAFRMARSVPADADLAQALAAVAAVAVALEIVDARYRDFQFWLPDVVADNASGCSFVLGPWMPPAEDLGDLPVRVDLDGKELATGSTSAIFDHPLQALRAAVRLGHATGRPLQAGSIVLAGSATDPVVLHPGARMRVQIPGLGEVAFSLGN